MKHKPYISCDICGREITKWNCTQVQSFWPGKYNPIAKRYDICNNCMSNLIALLHKQKEESNQ